MMAEMVKVRAEKDVSDGIKAPDVGVEWRNITVSLGENDILKQVSGHVKPGEMVAIMGPSGSGKTTLLNTITGRIHPKSWSGSLRVNQEDFDPANWGDRRCFVEQRDAVIDVLTPREILDFSAQLRLEYPGDIVARTLERLDLMSCADTQCGNTEKGGISGGQLKRVCIARDLITSPSFLILDEPTSGLDNYNALKVITILRKICDTSNTTVLLTIHQPNGAIAELIDRFAYMHNGEVVLQGTLGEMQTFVAAQGFPCPPYEILTDHIMTLSMELDEGVLKSWKEQAPGMLAPIAADFPSGGPAESHLWKSGFCKQLIELFKRQWKSDARGDGLAAPFLIPVLVSGFTCGLQWDAANRSAYNYQFAVNMVIIMNAFVTAMIPLKTYISEITIFCSELSTGTYSHTTYFFTKLLTITVKTFIIVVIGVVMSYYMLGLKGNIVEFTWWVFVLGYACSGWVAALGIMAGSMENAMEVFDVVITPQMMVAWVQLPKGLEFLEYVTSMKAAMFLAQLTEADDEMLIEWGTDANREEKGRYIAILMTHLVIVTFLAYFALWWRSSILYQ